ncbi:MAG: hypothetical protein AABX77_01775 [Nanoarchaeota archaeon]
MLQKLTNKNKLFSDNKLVRIKKNVVKTLKKYGIKKAGIFGSYVRGEQKNI